MRQPLTPPSVENLLHGMDPDRVARIVGVSPLVRGEYAPWDTVIRLAPPQGLSSEEWWLGIRLARNRLLNPVPLRDVQGAPFLFGMPDPVLRLVHQIDQFASGRVQIGEEVANSNTRDQYVFDSLMEEAITSSQLEGAATTSKVAREMLRSGRRPIDHGERMILNNFQAMRLVKRNTAQALTPEMVFDLHRTVAQDTLRDPDKVGRLRSESDHILVMDRYGTVLHRPPPAHELQERLEAMCRFANARDRPEEPFLHPVLRAIVLHFWIGHDHPFVDGNGRTARAIFYWSLLSQDYGLAEYLSISRILRREPGDYGRAFLHTESDGNDLTYFIVYQLDVIRRAIDELNRYLNRKVAQRRALDKLLARSARFNHRQKALLAHAVRHPGARYLIRAHGRSHGVAYDTARTDLLELADFNLLSKWQEGRTYVFGAPEKLERRLAALGGGGRTALGGGGRE